MRAGTAPRHDHVPFVLAGLALSILGGFVLAILLPASNLAGLPLDWTAYGQVHGHLQAIGFIGLVIVGVSYHLLPALSGAPLRAPVLVPASLWLIGGGVVARAIGQPASEQLAFAVLAGLGAWFELAGALCFMWNVLPLTARLTRNGEPAGQCLTAGVLWFVL